VTGKGIESFRGVFIMDKGFKIFILLLVAILAVGASGCLGGGGDKSTDDQTSNNSSTVDDIDDDDLNYSTNIVTVRDVPGYEFLSTQSVKSHAEGIGITDVLYGYRGYYKFTNDSVSNEIVYLYSFKTNGTAESEKYYQMMKNSYTGNYSGATLETVQLNGHEATKFTSGNGPDMIAWTRGNLLFVSKGQVAGQIDYETLKSLVVASNL